MNGEKRGGKRSRKTRKGGEKEDEADVCWQKSFRRAAVIFMLLPIPNCAIAMETRNMTHAKLSNTERWHNKFRLNVGPLIFHSTSLHPTGCKFVLYCSVCYEGYCYIIFMTETHGRLHEISFPSLATCTIPSGQKALRGEFWKNSVSRHLTCALWHHMAST